MTCRICKKRNVQTFDRTYFKRKTIMHGLLCANCVSKMSKNQPD